MDVSLRDRDISEELQKLFNTSENNGTFEVGLAAGVDKNLMTNEKLVVYSDARVRQVGANVKLSLSHLQLNEDYTDIERNIIIGAVVALHLFGLIDTTNSDVIVNDERGNSGLTNAALKDITGDVINQSLLLILSTKINLYQTNHHTGQGMISGFPKKVVESLFNLDKNQSKKWTKIVHMIGHWADTRITLHKLGVPGIKVGAMYANCRSMEITRDVSVRVNSMPSGTARVNLAYNILLRLKNHPLAACITDFPSIERVVTTYKKINDDKPKYHISAHYLTGSPRADYDDKDFDDILGLLGTFIVELFPNNSLAKSPLLNVNNDKRYKNFQGFDNDFFNICVAYKKESTKGVNVDVTALFPTMSENISERMKENQKRISELMDSKE